MKPMKLTWLAAWGLFTLAACSSPLSNSPSGTPSRAVAGAATLYGYTTAGAATAQNSNHFGLLHYNAENAIENNDWGIPQNGQGGCTVFTETINNQPAFGWAWNVTNGTNVAIYPEVAYGWSPNANASWGGSPIIAPISDNRAITSSFNIVAQHGTGNEAWDLAYDIWIMPTQHPASTAGGYELMIWLDHKVQAPWANSDAPGTATLNGVTYKTYTNKGVDGGWTVLSYINQGTAVLSSSSFNLADVIKNAAATFGIPGSYYVAAIEFGNEAINGSGMTEITNWSVNVGAVGSYVPGNGGGTTFALPGKVQASGYSALTGTMKLEACSDVGGGQDVGYTSVGGTLDYKTSVATSGSYSTSYRVASATGGSFDVLVDGTKVDTVTVPNTGGWQTWATVNGNKNWTLSAGTHTVQIKVATTSFNLNWLQVTGPLSNKAADFSLNTWQFTSSQGVTSWNGGVGNFVAGNWIGFANVNLSTGYNDIAIQFASTQSGSFTVRLDSPTGPVVGTVNYAANGGWTTFTWTGGALTTAAAGTHNVYLVAVSGAANLGSLWFKNL